MFEYLQKFNKLPRELREKVSNPTALVVINNLEKKYGVSLASLVLKIMVKDILAKDLVMVLTSEFKLNKEQAENLTSDLHENFFKGLEAYLGLPRLPIVKIAAPNELMAQTAPPVSSQPLKPVQIKGASFSFSPEDEEEIRKLAENLGGSARADLADNELNKKVEAIISKADIKFSSEFLLNRFKQIISTYLKIVRDRLDTKLTLKKEVAGGGLGMDEGAANKILLIADEILGKTPFPPIKAPIKIAVPEDLIKEAPSAAKLASLKTIGARDIDYDYSQLPKQASLKPAQASPAPQVIIKKVELDTDHELAPLPPVVIPEAKPKIIPPAAKVIKVSDIFSRAKGDQDKTSDRSEGVKPKIQIRKPSEPTGKIKIEDVKHIPRVMSPIDELGYMSLINFRRLAKSPFDAVAKIKEKIKLLEEERYSKKIEGVRAWRSNQVNKLYLEIGARSISQGKPVDVIIEERKKTGQDFLTIEEFEAILRLNKEIRF